jgi:hypothetical protein
MSAVDALNRAWQQFGIGLVFLVLAMLQVFAGKALFVGIGMNPEWVFRNKEPRRFWLAVILCAVIGLVGCGAGLPLILNAH